MEYRRIGPTLNNLLPCGGRFQLASENGQTVFPDAFGGHQSFYFPRAEGECCVPWDFGLELVRTDPDGFRETVQTSFRADYCLNAAPSPQLGQIIITSENPAPTGFPPTLVMEVEQLALLRALSVPVDASGNPTGEPPQDVRDLGYDVEFFLESPVEVVLDPGSLTLGHAFAIQPGDNVIHARLTPRAAETPRLAFWPPTVLGFAIARAVTEGREPVIIAGTLPVVVKGRITVTPTLIYRVEQGRTSVKVEAPPLFHLNNVPVREVERSEPFNNPRRYVLGLKINADPEREDATYEMKERPRAGSPAYEGSGGNYLSNEIFYRMALTRTREVPSLASGHLHIPPLRTSPRTLGPGLVHSVRTAAERFLKHLFRTRKSGDVTFPRTNVNTTSAPITLSATNITNETISVFTVDVAPPFAVQWPGPTPIPLSQGSSLPLPFTFRPTTPGVHTQTVKLRDSNGELLLLATLTGEAMPTYSVTGQVTVGGMPLQGVQVTLSGSRTASVITGKDGRYSFTNLDAGGNYTITPSKANYTFTPPSQAFSGLAANQTADFAATLNRHRIRGRVRTTSGVPIPNVTVTLFGPVTDTRTTDATGEYLFADLPAGGDYVVTVNRTNYDFTVVTQVFKQLAADAEFDFTGALVSYRISGHITDGSDGLGGVTVTLSGSQSSSATTDASGNYSFTVTAEGSYTVSPSKQHYTFTPQPVIFNNLGANQTADFAATLNRHTISGRVTGGGIGLGDVTVHLSGSQTGNVITDATGDYSVTDLPAGGDYTLTPSRANYTFSPASHSFGDLGASQTADFTGTPVSYTISGRVTSGGVGLADITVRLTGSETAAATTDAAGNYSFTVPAEGSYTVSPSEHYAFTPPSATFDNLAANQTADFGAPPNRHRISGRLTNPTGDALPNVLLSLTGSQSRTTRTDEAGNYSFANLPEGGNYTVTPRVFGYSFTPLSRTFNGLSADQARDFAAGPVGGVRINLALPSDGPVFSVSTMYRVGRRPSAVINGDLRDINWHDATPDGSPARLEISFAGLKTISEVHVFNIQENLAAITELAEATTFTQHGLQAFGVEYWTGADWQSVPGGAVTNNSRVWVKVAFPPLTTTKIRLIVRRALGG